MSEQSAYISRVHLKGYKSIKDLEIDFNPGLNIIIGPNGSGKSNFLEFLDLQTTSIFIQEYSDGKLSNFEASVHFYNKIEFWGKYQHLKRTITAQNATIKLEDSTRIRVVKVSEIIRNLSNDVIFKRTYDISDEGVINHKGESSLGISNYNFVNLVSTNYLTFNNPLSELLKSKIVINIERYEENYILQHSDEHEEDEILKYYQTASLKNLSNSGLEFISTVVSKIFDESDLETDDIDPEELIEALNFPASFGDALKRYTPISAVDFDREIVTVNSKYSNSLDLDNVFIKFFVNREWVKWNALSDGTKRMFYLIGNVYFSKNKEIILLEEPELGIHPHQLSRLMDFLKEQSATKQIIITTHSPQVLNELKADELDHIIVTRHEGERGTQMYHLSEEEKGFAQDYMQNVAFLSDYWVQSGFMQEEDILL